MAIRHSTQGKKAILGLDIVPKSRHACILPLNKALHDDPTVKKKCSFRKIVKLMKVCCGYTKMH